MINEQQTGIILAALRHLQYSMENGDDVSSYEDMTDLSVVSGHDIDSLCERINGVDTETKYHLCLSTAHMTHEDMQYLLSMRDCSSVWKRNYGVMLMLPECTEPDEILSIELFDDHAPNLSLLLLNALQWAYDQGYRIVEFDQDGHELDQLPRCEW